MKRAFTLIELLVVVLIVGILSAIALPQYQKAVVKTRYTTMKSLAHSLLNAEEVYFLANGVYTNDMTALDVTAPADTHITCWADLFSEKTDVYIRCSHDQIEMAYQIYPPRKQHSNVCVVHNTDLSSIQAKVCKQETGKENPSQGINSTTYRGWTY
ncbi:MAG: pilin [Elusimicrobiaceae bacterium]|nr:pilin [Elusimicrobiaceae bacterium]